MICDTLKSIIDKGIDIMQSQNAPGFVIADYLSEMMSGDAALCTDCKQRKNCFEKEATHENR